MHVFMSVGIAPTQIEAKNTSLQIQRVDALASETVYMTFHSVESVAAAISALDQIRENLQGVANAAE